MNDEVWEAAGLQCNGTFPLELFSYNNSVLLDVIFRHVKETSFNGITVSAAKIWAKKGGGGEREKVKWKGKRREGIETVMEEGMHRSGRSCMSLLYICILVVLYVSYMHSLLNNISKPAGQL